MADTLNHFQKDPILFYDGQCGLCNRSIQLILRHEKSSKVYFSPLQSAFAKEVLNLNASNDQQFTTIYFKTEDKVLIKSAAAFALLPYLKWYWQPMRIFQLLPTKWTDHLYSFISRRRTKLVSSYCLVPTEAQVERFIN